MDWRPAILFYFIGVAFAQGIQLRPTTAQTEGVTKSQNESYVVTCITNSSEKGVWTGPRGSKLPIGSGRVHVEDRGPNVLSLMFDRIEVMDKGQYVCTSNNEQASFNLSVIKVPQLRNSPAEHKVKEFHTTLIRCEVDAEPRPVITWKKNGVNVIDINSSKYVLDPVGLKVINASRADAGVYTCTALQISSGDVYAWDITLRVEHTPEWKEPGGEVKAFGYLTGETNLTCEAVAEPEANYTWSRVNHSHKHLPHNTTEIREPGRSVLKMYVQNDSYGVYKCEAHNPLGRISRVFSLSRGEKPSPPTRVHVVGTTIHNATLEVDSDTADLVGYRAQFVIARPGTDVTWDRPDYQDLVKNDHGHYVIIDLLEDTPYAVRVATRSIAGLSDLTTDHKTFRTEKQNTNLSWKVASQPAVIVLSIIALKTVH